MFRSAKEKMRECIKLATPREWRRLARGSRGSQLLEVALALPILVTLAVGGSDFSDGYNMKQKLNNAAREGARFGGAVSTIDDTQTSCNNYSPAVTAPCSVQGIQNVVLGYLSNTETKVGVCGMTTGTSPSSTGALSWTYTSSCSPSGTFTITIERGYNYVDSSSGATVIATRLTVSHPYTWSIGRVIGLLGGSFPSTITISSNAIMRNIP
jgi:Flp pilus assembly protein TadG